MNILSVNEIVVTIKIVVITNTCIKTTITICIGELKIETKPTVKTLGVMINRKMSFSEQIQCTSDKASRLVTSLSRFMATLVGSLRCSSRRLLMSSAISALFPAVDRRLRLCCSVYVPAILVIAGFTPLHILALEWQAIYRRRLGWTG